jgi:hypothetical protein
VTSEEIHPNLFHRQISNEVETKIPEQQMSAKYSQLKNSSNIEKIL